MKHGYQKEKRGPFGGALINTSQFISSCDLHLIITLELKKLYGRKSLEVKDLSLILTGRPRKEKNKTTNKNLVYGTFNFLIRFFFSTDHF